jgi:hypothetical protein
MERVGDGGAGCTTTGGARPHLSLWFSPSVGPTRSPTGTGRTSPHLSTHIPKQLWQGRAKENYMAVLPSDCRPSISNSPSRPMVGRSIALALQGVDTEGVGTGRIGGAFCARHVWSLLRWAPSLSPCGVVWKQRAARVQTCKIFFARIGGRMTKVKQCHMWRITVPRSTDVLSFVINRCLQVPALHRGVGEGVGERRIANKGVVLRPPTLPPCLNRRPLVVPLPGVGQARGD